MTAKKDSTKDGGKRKTGGKRDGGKKDGAAGSAGSGGRDPLAEYRGKRDPGRTPEPVPDEKALPHGDDDTFVVQEHHATSLHWDLRLERDGVLVSWAVPKGLPWTPETNHLAVHTEDHPLEYAAFEGEIPAGEYGGGTMTVWDRGTYETEKWNEREVKIVLHGGRVSGRYVLFRTGGKNWMIHRMDPPADPDAEPLPEVLRPMLPVERARLRTQPQLALTSQR
ncbi:DNA polymerase ligase N-terminal domain-containing protein [Actinomadura fibrosa]|uniref:DNA polymerase ligase N-terminal domain-containing protein n=1 Tax=Actinomadura fibrosa TaxID=111802 RepID=UPI00104126B5|nr:DNA polymerase ligase N-terminal domain-containing protein [Actinomadura fibrosa]